LSENADILYIKGFEKWIRISGELRTLVFADKDGYVQFRGPL